MEERGFALTFDNSGDGLEAHTYLVLPRCLYELLSVALSWFELV